MISGPVLNLGLALAVTLSGCAGVTVSSDAEGRHPEGLRVHPPRAVLLPQVIGADGAVVSTRLAWIPDLRRSIEARTTAGLGRTGLALSLQEGSSYAGYLVELETRTTESRLPEVLRASGDAAAAALAGAALLGADRR